MHEPIPPHILDNFCGSRYFTRFPKSILKFQDKIGTKLKDNLKEFLAKNKHATHANHIKTCMECANVLFGRLGSRISQDHCTTVIIWDTGALFGLIPFKSNSIYYVNCDIPVKDVEKVNTVIGIGKKIIGLLMQMENIYSYLAFLIISQPRMCNFSLQKLIIIFMVHTPSLKYSMFKRQ